MWARSSAERPLIGRRRPGLRRSAVVAALATALAPAAAQAATGAPKVPRPDAGRAAGSPSLRQQPLTSDVRRPVGDGRTITAWETADGRTISRDALGRMRVVSAPADCPLTRFAGAGGGVVLLQCLDDGLDPIMRSRYIVLRPGTENISRVTLPVPPVGTGPRLVLNAVGGRWARGVGIDGPAVQTVWVDWRTGRTVTGSTDPFGPQRWLDLDAPALARALCAPHRRQERTDDAAPPADRFEDGPLVQAGWVLADPGFRYGSTPRLGRCGGVLRPVGPDAGSAAFIGGHLVWRARVNQDINLVRLRDGRRFAFDGAGAFTTGTARELLVWTPGSDPLLGTLTIVRLPA